MLTKAAFTSPRPNQCAAHASTVLHCPPVTCLHCHLTAAPQPPRSPFQSGSAGASLDNIIHPPRRLPGPLTPTHAHPPSSANIQGRKLDLNPLEQCQDSSEAGAGVVYPTQERVPSLPRAAQSREGRGVPSANNRGHGTLATNDGSRYHGCSEGAILARRLPQLAAAAVLSTH